MMRYELNFDEDKVNDVLDKGGASYDLKGCCKIMNEQQSTITELKEENEKLQKQVESSETTMNATSHYNAFLESKISTLEKENEQLKQKLENMGLNEKNDMVKMVDGKVFIRM